MTTQLTYEAYPTKIIERSFSSDPDDINVTNIAIEANNTNETNAVELNEIVLTIPDGLASNMERIAPTTNYIGELSVSRVIGGQVTIVPQNEGEKITVAPKDSFLIRLNYVEVNTEPGDVQITAQENGDNTATQDVEFRKIDPALRIDTFKVNGDIPDAKSDGTIDIPLSWSVTGAEKVELKYNNTTKSITDHDGTDNITVSDTTTVFTLIVEGKGSTDKPDIITQQLVVELGNGNVGIGTANPSSKSQLHIKGRLRVSDVIPITLENAQGRDRAKFSVEGENESAELTLSVRDSSGSGWQDTLILGGDGSASIAGQLTANSDASVKGTLTISDATPIILEDSRNRDRAQFSVEGENDSGKLTLSVIDSSGSGWRDTLVLGGDGSASIAGQLTVNSDVTVKGDLTVNSDATVKGDLTVNSDATVNGKLIVNSIATVKSTLQVTKDIRAIGTIGNSSETEVIGGWQLGKWHDNPAANKWLYLRKTKADAYQNLAVGEMSVSTILYVAGHIQVKRDDENYWKIGSGNFGLAGEYNALWVEVSDMALKKDIAPVSDAIDKLVQLRGVTYHWNEEGLTLLTRDIDNLSAGPDSTEQETAILRQNEKDKRIRTKLSQRRMGLIAQEVEAIIPEVVYTEPSGNKAIHYQHLVGLLVEAIKEQQGMLDTLRNQIDELRTH